MSLDWAGRDSKREGRTDENRGFRGRHWDGLREEFGRDPTAAEIKDFEAYLERDVGTWLSENFRSFTRKLREEGRLK